MKKLSTRTIAIVAIVAIIAILAIGFFAIQNRIKTPDSVVENGERQEGQGGEEETAMSSEREGASDISYEIPLVVKDPSFFFVSLGLSNGDIAFNLPQNFKIEDVKKIQAYEMGDENHEYSKGFPRPDLPETLQYTFASKTKEFSGAFLEIYPLPEGLAEGKFPVELTDEFVFPKHITRLWRTLEERPENIGNEWGSIVYFPRVSATPIAISDEKYFENDFFTGVRYTIQYTQAVAPADFPIYTFQGITRDKKYFILFRYASLYSPRLERVLQKESRGLVANESKYKEYLKESFEELSLEQNFVPALSELDTFVQSLRAGL